MRLQLALNVDDLETAMTHYTKMFGVSPHKVRDGYANYSIDEPPLKLVLFEKPGAAEKLNHIGVEMFDHADVDITAARFEAADILGSVQKNTVCCHADQDKVWSKHAQGLRWEWYVINDDQPGREGSNTNCCAQPAQTSS
jgi:hypothetical protein